jgi:BlaI family transcriptional regulator, penicillinase repressor
MREIPQISEAELQVMKVIWAKGEATSAHVIEALSQATDWKPKTIQTLITRLTAKGAVQAEPTGGKAYVYSPLVSESQYKAHANESFLKKLYDGSAKLMLTSFIKEQKLSREEIENLKKLLEEEGG